MDQVHPDQVWSEVVKEFWGEYLSQIAMEMLTPEECVQYEAWLVESNADLKHSSPQVCEWRCGTAVDKPQAWWERYYQLGGIQVQQIVCTKYTHLRSHIANFHRQNVYGFLDEEDAEEEEHGFSYKQMEARDSRRWSMADLDHSGELDIQVRIHFLQQSSEVQC